MEAYQRHKFKLNKLKKKQISQCIVEQLSRCLEEFSQ